MLQETNEKSLPAIIRPECHFLEFPFFALSRKGLKDKKELIFRYEEMRNGNKGVFEWRVLPSAKYGCPSPFDRRVMRAVDAVIYEEIENNGYPVESPIQFSIYHLADLMNISSSGEIYRKMKDSLRRVVSTTVSSSGSFWLKDKKRWVEDVFHVYERIKFVGEKTEDGETVETNCLWLGDFVLRNINSHYVRPLNYIYLASLKSDIAGRLYEILSSKFYGLIRKDGTCFNIDYSILCQLLPATPQKYLSQAEQKLGKAHSELITTEFLEKVDLRTGKNGYVVVYYPGKRATELTQPVLMNDVDDNQILLPFVKEEDESVQLSELGQGLHSRGLSRSVSLRFCRKYPEDYICQKLKIFDFLRSTGSELISKNSGGWLRRAIEENWQPSEEQQKKEENKKRKDKEQDRRNRWREHRKTLIDQNIATWDKTPQEQRIAGRLEFWIMGQKLNERQATQEEIEAEKQKLMDSLPKNDEEKRDFFEREIDINPPEDFI